MENNQKCIICSRPIGTGGFIGTIKDMSVSFCKEHADSCKRECERCMHAVDCPVFRGAG
jgi:hypothetical protein